MADEPLLLGLADGNMSENDDKICGWSTNKIGGKPNWLHGQPLCYPACPLCGKVLYLVCQIYCPLSDSTFHRVLYVFGCVSKSCWTKNASWKVLRSQAKDNNFVNKETVQDKPSGGFEVDDWCDDADDWEDDNDFSMNLEHCTGKLTLSDDKPEEADHNTAGHFNPNQPHLETSSAYIPHFASMFISAVEAPDPKAISTELTKHEKALLSEYELREGGHVLDASETREGPKEWTGEKYESAALKHGDKAFHKFKKQLHACPQQCLRYQWNGVPVSMVTFKPSELYSRVPSCQHCGANRVFEVQFMPSLIGNLKLAKHLSTTSKADLSSQNDHDRDKEHFSDVDNTHNLGSLDNNICEDNSGNMGLLEDQRKTFLAAVNQANDIMIEFGTVMVFTCAKSCWKENAGEVYLEEFCLVEADPDVLLFQ